MSEIYETPLRRPPVTRQRGRIRMVGGWRHAVFSGLGALLGILTAFAIDAWWDNRQGAVRERTYLIALHAETIASKQLLEAHMRARADAMGVMKRQIETISTSQAGAASADSINVLLVDIAPYYDFAPQRAVLNEMLAVGGLQLVRSPDIRRVIAAYEQALALDRSTQDDALAFWRLQMSPYLILHANWPATTRLNPRIEEEVRPQATVFPFEADPSAFFGNQIYANLLMSRLLTERRVRIRQQNVLMYLDSLLVLLDRNR